MPIVASDIVYRLSGGAGNTNPNSALGGAISTAGGGLINSGVPLNNMFDDVSGDESDAGDVEYRCIFVRNDHGSLTLQNPVLWIQSTTPSSDTVMAIAVADEGVANTVETIANEGTAPSGPSFSSPTSKGAGIALPDIAAGAAIGIWVRRTVTSSAAAANNDVFTLRVEGETGA